MLLRADAMSWRAGKSSAERGYGYRWQMARARYLQHNPLCVMCLPKVVQATVVDHKIPHRGDQQLFWNEGNWQSLCKPHHDSTRQAEDKGSSRQRVGEDGWPGG